MTQSVPAAPGAPADPAQPAIPGQAADPQPTPPGQDPNAPIDFDTLPANVKAHIAQLRKEAGTHRTGKTAADAAANEAKTRLDGVLKALGLNVDGTANTDPEALAKQLTQRATAAEEALWGATVKFEIHTRASALGANAAALLDSVTFVDSLDELADADPSSAEFRTALEAKIRDAVAKNPALRGGPAAPARQGVDVTGSGGGSRQRPAGLGAALAARMTSGR